MPKKQFTKILSVKIVKLYINYLFKLFLFFPLYIKVKYYLRYLHSKERDS